MEKKLGIGIRLQPEPDWRDSFQGQDPEGWGDVWDLVELAEQIQADPKLEAATWLLYNRYKAAQLHGWPEVMHTVPSAEHYRNTYFWDSAFFINMYAEAADLAGRAADYFETQLAKISEPQLLLKISGVITEMKDRRDQFLEAAVTESAWIANKQKDNGFIANLHFAEGPPRWFDVEWWLSVDKQKRSSNYTQPPVLALAALTAYTALKGVDTGKAEAYGHEMFVTLDNLFRFLAEHRANSSADPMLGVVDPHETGLDSSVQWDYTKPLRPRDKGPDHDIKELFETRIIDGGYAVLRQFEMWSAGGDQAKLRELFWANDVSFNAIYVHNLQAIARLAAEIGQAEAAKKYEALSEAVEHSLLDQLWFSGDEIGQDGRPKVPQKGFYSLRAEGEPIDKITISNLFGLVLPHINELQLEAVLDMLDGHFDVPFPLPSCSTQDPAYDPDNHEKDRLWRGPTWLNTNWYLAEFGLKMQGRRPDINLSLKQRCLEWAVRIGESSKKLLELNHKTTVPARQALGRLTVSKSLESPAAERHQKRITGAWEHYHPHTGEGQRGRVINFGWSWLGTFIDTEKENQALRRINNGRPGSKNQVPDR